MKQFVNKNEFAFYLEETTLEIRGFKLSRAYLDDVIPCLKHAADRFYQESYEDCTLKIYRENQNATDKEC